MSSATTPAQGERQDSPDDRGFLGQPRVLANLFGVELWERFSFYGMQGILLIYLYYSVTRGGLGIEEGTATGIVGAYGGAVYLSTILGAWLADRVVGPERTLFLSAVVVMAGHVALAVLPGLSGVTVGLVLVALGSGGVKANATSLVGSLYDEHDERRDAGFSLFYMGINIGALVGPLLTGVLQQEAGFHLGFGLAAVGMAAGLVQYTVGRRRLPASTAVVPNPLGAHERTRYVVAGVVALAVLVAALLSGLVTAEGLPDLVIGLTVVAAVAYFVVMLADRSLSGVERSRVWAMVPLFLASAVFWSLYQQQFTVVTIFADQRLDRDLFGWTMPVSWVQSINPVFIIVLAGAFAALWTRLGDRAPSTPVKFGLATLLMGIAFWLFLLVPSGSSTVPVLALAGILLVFTVAELLLSPVGLSVATKLAPARFRTQMVALFFLSVALGSAVAGQLGGYYATDAEGAFFGWVGGAAVATGLVVLAVARPVRRLMAGVR